MLDAIYGIGTSSAGTTNPVQALQLAEKNQTQDVANTAAQPTVQVAMKAFTQAVSSAKSVDQLLSNPAFMNVFLTANSMSDQIGFAALAKQALTSNLSDPNSLANTLTDTRWKTVAQTYNLSSPGALASLQSPATVASIANAYATATWEANEDKVTPGLSNALAFKAQAATITSVDQVLGNPTVRNVVTTALGIPEQIAFQDIGAQENAISLATGQRQPVPKPVLRRNLCPTLPDRQCRRGGSDRGILIFILILARHDHPGDSGSGLPRLTVASQAQKEPLPWT